MRSNLRLSGLVSPLCAIPRMIADLVFPPACLCCNAPLPDGRSSVCGWCRDAMAAVDEWDTHYRRALEGLTPGGTVGGFVAAWYFDAEGPVQSLVHALKYGGFTAVGTDFGRVLGERVLEAGYGEADAIVPVPLHPSRLRERGFNQAACIARGVSSVTGIPPAGRIVRRTRSTHSQTVLAPAERRANMRDAFRPVPRPAHAAGMTVLLVDDVVTTGATMCACAGALRAAGVRSVVACAAALAR